MLERDGFDLASGAKRHHWRITAPGRDHLSGTRHIGQRKQLAVIDNDLICPRLTPTRNASADFSVIYG